MNWSQLYLKGSVFTKKYCMKNKFMIAYHFVSLAFSPRNAHNNREDHRSRLLQADHWPQHAGRCHQACAGFHKRTGSFHLEAYPWSTNRCVMNSYTDDPTRPKTSL